MVHAIEMLVAVIEQLMFGRRRAPPDSEDSASTVEDRCGKRAAPLCPLERGAMGFDRRTAEAAQSCRIRFEGCRAATGS
jgi:hypothetical protein